MRRVKSCPAELSLMSNRKKKNLEKKNPKFTANIFFIDKSVFGILIILFWLWWSSSSSRIVEEAYIYIWTCRGSIGPTYEPLTAGQTQYVVICDPVWPCFSIISHNLMDPVKL